MEQEKTNIAALLKDCPKGTKLYSPICGECNFLKINPRGEILVYFNGRDDIPMCLNEHGFQFEGGECLLFPSKENRDWSTFKKPEEEQPKFKVGDVVIRHDGNFADMLVVSKDPLIGEATRYNVVVDDMEKYNCTLATPEEIAKWNEETLHPNHLHYSKSKRKIIHWFLPFDKCIVRDAPNETWTIEMFSFYHGDSSSPYQCLCCYWKYCLPYNENTAKLIGTTDDWEEE